MKRLQLDILVLLVFAVIVCYESSRLPLGSASKPGPGLFPLILGLMLGVLSLFFLLSKGVKYDKEAGSPWPRGSGKRVLTTLGTLCAYSVVFSYLGYLVSTLFLTFYLLSLSYPGKWIRNGIASIFICFVFYIVFHVIFEIEFPSGMLGI